MFDPDQRVPRVHTSMLAIPIATMAEPIQPDASSLPFAAPASAAARKPWTSVLAELLRARLTLLVLVSVVAGYYLGVRERLDWAGLWHTLAGTTLLACAASALNQWWERGTDALMARTRRRPLPEGRLSPRTVLIGGVTAAVAGMLYLGWIVNPATCVLGGLSLVVYLFLYTPLKRRTWLNTWVGSISGALPPLMGWTGAAGEVGPGGLALFMILACWQLPHFLAIAWIYREDYSAAGLRMLPVVDRTGRRTGAHAVAFACLLIPLSCAPWALGLTGAGYLAVALALGLWLARAACSFRRDPTLATARRLFRVSVWHLSWLLVAMMADKVR